jgi:mannosyl-oligosaccharide alpha-1,2-mannosidase
MAIMYNATVPDGLFPTKWDLELGTPTNSMSVYINFTLNADHTASEDYSVGAFADSAYEYLLKQWLMTGKTEAKSRDLCKSSASSLLHCGPHLLYLFRSQISERYY